MASDATIPHDPSLKSLEIFMAISSVLQARGHRVAVEGNEAGILASVELAAGIDGLNEREAFVVGERDPLVFGMKDWIAERKRPVRRFYVELLDERRLAGAVWDG